MYFNVKYLTTAGKDLLDSAIANPDNKALLWTKCATSDLSYANDLDRDINNVHVLTDILKPNSKYSSLGSVTSTSATHGESTSHDIKIRCLLTNDENENVASGFASAFGVWAKLGNNGEDTLVAVAFWDLRDGSSPELVPPHSEREYSAEVDLLIRTSDEIVTKVESVPGWMTPLDDFNDLKDDVDDLRDEHDSLASDVTTLTTNYNTLNTNVNTLTTNFNALNSNVTTLTTNYNTLNTNVNTLTTNVNTLTTDFNAIQGRVVTTHASSSSTAGDDQTIYGKKTFKNLCTDTIGVENDSNNTLAVKHNIIDLKKTANSYYYTINNKLKFDDACSITHENKKISDNNVDNYKVSLACGNEALDNWWQQFSSINLECTPSLSAYSETKTNLTSKGKGQYSNPEYITEYKASVSTKYHGQNTSSAYNAQEYCECVMSTYEGGSKKSYIEMRTGKRDSDNYLHIHSDNSMSLSAANGITMSCGSKGTLVNGYLYTNTYESFYENDAQDNPSTLNNPSIGVKLEMNANSASDGKPDDMRRNLHAGLLFTTIGDGSSVNCISPRISTSLGYVDSTTNDVTYRMDFGVTLDPLLSSFYPSYSYQYSQYSQPTEVIEEKECPILLGRPGMPWGGIYLKNPYIVEPNDYDGHNYYVPIGCPICIVFYTNYTVSDYLYSYRINGVSSHEYNSKKYTLDVFGGHGAGYYNTSSDYFDSKCYLADLLAGYPTALADRAFIPRGIYAAASAIRSVYNSSTGETLHHGLFIRLSDQG